MTPQKTAPCCGLGWLAIVKAGALPLYRTSQETPVVVGRTQLETGLVTKDYMSPESTVDWARHHSNRT